MGRVMKGLAAPRRTDAAAAQGVGAAAGEAGRQAALAEGRAAAAVEVAALLVAARHEAARLLAAAQPAALVLAAKMAERIVGRAVALQPAVMAEIAAEALAACRPRAGLVRLRAHPDDVAALEAGLPLLQERLAAGARLEIAPDETVGRHGCVVETAVGAVDARLETQLAALQRAVAGQGDG